MGRVLHDKYRLIEPVAAGGMGRIYRAEQAPLGRTCAVKVLLPSRSGETEEEFKKRFLREASVGAKLSHPNTIKVFDYATTEDGLCYMALEYLEGMTLHEALQREGALEPKRAMRIAVQICKSLREAHSQGVIHRDLKPGNIFLINRKGEGEFVKVLDFGLVKRMQRDETGDSTRPGLVAGSPKYMSPEQVRDGEVSPATDVYALGVVMYEMLTGKVPFDEGHTVHTLMAHARKPVPPMEERVPGCNPPRQLQDVVFRCLAKEPMERFTSMEDLANAIKTAVSNAYSGARLAVPGTGMFPSGATPTPVSGESLVPTSGPSTIPPGRNSISPSGSNSIPPPRTSLAPGGSGASLAPPSGAVAVPSVAPPPAPRAPSVAPPPARRTPTVGIVAGAAVSIAVISLVVGYGLARGRNAAASAAASANAQGSTAAAASAPAAPTVRVSLSSDPPGAEVLEDGAVIGRTPLLLTWTGERGDPARSHTFTFRMSEYQDSSVTLTGAEMIHTARLERTTATPRARPRARVRRGGSMPSGYRGMDDPHGGW